MYHSLLWSITDKSPLWLEQIFTPFQVNKNKIYHQQLWSAVIYSCYCIIFVDLLCIFEFTLYFWILFYFIYYSTYRRMVFLANQSRFLCCLQHRILDCTCIDTVVQFLHHTSQTFPCSIVL